MNAPEQHDDIRIGEKARKKSYTAPVLSEYGSMTTVTQGTLTLNVVTLLSVSVIDLLI